MSRKRDVLEPLKRDELLAAADRFGVVVRDRRVRDDLIEALAASRQAGLADVLDGLSRSRLKEVCRALGLDDSGREKATIIARLTGRAPSPPPPHRSSARPTPPAPPGEGKGARRMRESPVLTPEPPAGFGGGARSAVVKPPARPAPKAYRGSEERMPDLRDTEQVPLLEDGGIETFLQREVLPHAPDAWYNPESVKVGYEISFTRYFYKPKPLRTLEEIRADILALERETEGLLAEIVGVSR